MNTNATQPNEAQAREALAKRLSRRLSSSVAFAAVMEAVDTAIKAGKLVAHVEICCEVRWGHNKTMCGEDGWHCELAREKYIEGSGQ